MLNKRSTQDEPDHETDHDPDQPSGKIVAVVSHIRTPLEIHEHSDQTPFILP